MGLKAAGYTAKKLLHNKQVISPKIHKFDLHYEEADVLGIQNAKKNTLIFFSSIFRGRMHGLECPYGIYLYTVPVYKQLTLKSKLNLNVTKRQPNYVNY